MILGNLEKEAISIISFDLNGTLVNREYADYFWLRLIPQVYAEKHKLSFDDAFSYVISEYDRIGPNDIRWYIPKYWLNHFDLDVDLEELIEKTLSKVIIYPEVSEVLRELDKKFTLIIASNTASEFIYPILKKIYAEVGYEVFEKVFSCVTNLNLPRKEAYFYEYICRSLNVTPKVILHVGDDLKYDYKIPISVGMKACLIDRKGELNFRSQIIIIKDLRELLNLL